MSVAFAVIITAVFCVLIQLFKLFSGGKPAFDRINRRNRGAGYDRIALEEDDEEALGETTALNA